MTVQVSDNLTLSGVSYTVTGADPYPIFHPDMLGIEVSPMGTWCWSGFFVHYECKDGQLFARSMQLGVFDSEPLVNGIKPDPLFNSEDQEVSRMLGRHYTDVWLPLEYTGEVMLGSDRCDSLERKHFGSPRSVEFNEIKKVVFLKGKVQAIMDISEQHVEERENLIELEQEKREMKWAIEDRKRRRVRFKRKILGFFTGKKQPMATHREHW